MRIKLLLSNTMGIGNFRVGVVYLAGYIVLIEPFKERIRFLATGQQSLIWMKAKEGEDHTNWLLLKERDDYALADDGISQFTTSIRSGRTMEEIEAGAGEKIVKNPFDKADIQLASLRSGFSLPRPLRPAFLTQINSHIITGIKKHSHSKPEL